MLALAGGREAGRTLDPREFAGQHRAERGFFVSLHELTSTYPTLSKRTADIEALGSGSTPATPPRHPLSWFLALFIPSTGGNAMANLVLTMVMVGLLAAMAVPAFNKVREASQVAACSNNHRMIGAAFDQYVLENGGLPERVEQFIGAGKVLAALPACPAAGSYSFSVDGEQHLVVTCSVHGTLEEMNARRAAAIR